MSRKELIRVSSKGQIVLPKRCRDRMKVAEGDYVTVYELDDGIRLLEKLAESPLDAVAADLRAEARRRKFTRQELESEIRKRRAGQRSNAG